MANNGQVDIDTLNIQIAGDADKVDASIGKFVGTLNNLAAVASPVASRLKSIAKAFKDLAGDSVATATGKVTDTVKNFKDLGLETEKVTKKLEGTQAEANSLAKTASALGLSNVSKEIKEVGKSIGLSKIGEFTQQMENFADVLDKTGKTEAGKAIRELAKTPQKTEKDLADITQKQKEASEAEKLAIKAAAEAKKKEQKELERMTKEMNEVNKKAAKEFEEAKKREEKAAREATKAAEKEAAAKKKALEKEQKELERARLAQEKAALKGTSKEAKDIARTLKDMGYDGFASKMKGIGDTLAKSKEEFAGMRSKLLEFANALSKAGQTDLAKKVNKLANASQNAGRKVKESTKAIRENARESKKASKETTSHARSFDKLLKSIGRIALYRAIRTLIKSVTSAIKEGLTNLYTYSSEVGTAFAPAVDNLRQHVTMLKNSFATALRPAIEALIPVVIQLVDWFSKLADFAAQVLSIIFGKVDDKGRYTKAVLGDLEQSNKEAKELKRTLLGFDEINRLDGDTGSGSEKNLATTQFVQADISENARKFADALKSVDWKLILSVGSVLAAVAAAKMLGWKGLAGTFLLASAFFGEDIANAVDKGVGKINGFFDSIDVGQSTTGKAIKEWLKSITKLVGDTVGGIARVVYKLAHGDIKGALFELIDLVTNIIKGIVDVSVGAVNIILGVVSDLLTFILKGVQWLYNHGIQPFLNAIVVEWKQVFEVEIPNVWTSLKIVFLQLLKWVIEKLNVVFKWLEDQINTAVEFMNNTFGTNIKPIKLTSDTSQLEETISELKNKKLPDIDQNIDFVPKWDGEIEPLNLRINAEPLKSALDDVNKKTKEIVNNLYKASGAVNAMRENSGKSMSTVKFTMFADGGYPTAGSMFVAGEAGAEVVANINGRTGVMNTDQMAAAIYNAMSSALANNPQGGGDIYLDGEVIYKNTVRRNNNLVRATGRSALLT